MKFKESWESEMPLKSRTEKIALICCCCAQLWVLSL